MLEEATTLIGLQIYTNHGVFVGVVNNIVANLNNYKLDGLYVEATNPALVEASRPVTIPFRWVQNVGDIIILRHFPKHVDLTEQERMQLMFEQGQYAEME
jgi:sporulation protein YlmC with PRC-barrel domain